MQGWVWNLPLFLTRLFEIWQFNQACWASGLICEMKTVKVPISLSCEGWMRWTRVSPQYILVTIMNCLMREMCPQKCFIRWLHFKKFHHCMNIVMCAYTGHENVNFTRWQNLIGPLSYTWPEILRYSIGGWVTCWNCSAEVKDGWLQIWRLLKCCWDFLSRQSV